MNDETMPVGARPEPQRPAAGTTPTPTQGSPAAEEKRSSRFRKALTRTRVLAGAAALGMLLVGGVGGFALAHATDDGPGGPGGPGGDRHGAPFDGEHGRPFGGEDGGPFGGPGGMPHGDEGGVPSEGAPELPSEGQLPSEGEGGAPSEDLDGNGEPS